MRASTAKARNDVARISLTPKSVEQSGRTAVVVIEVRGPDGPREVRLNLVHRGNDWLVVRSAGACGDVTCY